MALKPFLAMTGAEMRNTEDFPRKTAWLSCHFSASGDGLSNLPQALPPESLLVIDDASPVQGHDPDRVTQQVREMTEALGCCAVLLDFQRRDQEGAANMAAALVKSLPCPVAVSALYAKNLDCPVFLPPVPSGTPLSEFLWKGRECWLELALDGQAITVTQSGATISPLGRIPEQGFQDRRLHCHYALELQAHQAKWSLWRTREDVQQLLEEAERLGITQAVGLYQELG